MADAPTPAPPVMIELALNGQTPKQANPNVPRSSEEITADALRCLEAGACIVHTHIAEIMVGPERAAELYLEHFRPILERRPDALVYPTMGMGEAISERLGHLPILVRECGLRIGLIDPGSVNLGGADAAGLPAPIEYAYVNTPAQIADKVELCRDQGLGPSVAIFEPGFLNHILAYERAGRLPRGALIKFYMGGEYGYMGPGGRGVSFGLPPETWALDVYLRLMEGSTLPWSVGVLGGDVFARGLARHALERGGHLHVGLEDHMGPDQPTNLEIVEASRQLCAEVRRPVATPDEAAKLLDLPRQEGRPAIASRGRH